MTTVRDALRDSAQRLTPGIGDAARREARVLLERITGQTRIWIYQNPDAHLTAPQARQLAAAVRARRAGEPLAYLVGSREFYGRRFQVDQRVLIPRPETEDLVEAALAFARERAAEGQRDLRIVDVGTGSGVIAVTLAAELPPARIIAVDRSAGALAVAHENARRHGVEGRITLIQGDLLSAVAGPVDLIVANLPYIPTEEIPTLQPEVQHEPRLALDGGPDGLDLYRRLWTQAATALDARGGLFGEIAASQGVVAEHSAAAAFPDRSIKILPDLAGRDRIIAVGPRLPAITPVC